MSYEEGLRLYAARQYWEAHEAWEQDWKATDDPVQRAFFQGLIQLAAALLKLERNEPRGAAKLEQRARRNLEKVRAAASHYMGVDLDRLLEDMDRLAERPPALA